MAVYKCMVCNTFVYDEDRGDVKTGLAPGTVLDDFPPGWKCPICGAYKSRLRLLKEIEAR